MVLTVGGASLVLAAPSADLPLAPLHPPAAVPEQREDYFEPWEVGRLVNKLVQQDQVAQGRASDW